MIEHVRFYMQRSIDHFALHVEEIPGYVVLEKPGNCRLYLLNELIWISLGLQNPRDPNRKFELLYYMTACFPQVDFAYPRSKVPRTRALSTDEYAQWVGDHLSDYDRIIIDYLERPMKGDYSWADAHDRVAKRLQRSASKPIGR